MKTWKIVSPAGVEIGECYGETEGDARRSANVPDTNGLFLSADQYRYQGYDSQTQEGREAAERYLDDQFEILAGCK